MDVMLQYWPLLLFGINGLILWVRWSVKHGIGKWFGPPR